MKNKIPTPAILSANDLRLGHVLYWAGTEWKTDVNLAKIANNDEEVADLQAVAAKYVAENKILQVEIFPIVQTEKGIRSKTLRESFLISGPTIEYGKVQGAQ